MGAADCAGNAELTGCRSSGGCSHQHRLAVFLGLIAISGVASQQCSFLCSGCVIALPLPGCSSSEWRDPRKGADCLGSSVLFPCQCHNPNLPEGQWRGQACPGFLRRIFWGQVSCPVRTLLPAGVISRTRSCCTLAPGPGREQPCVEVARPGHASGMSAMWLLQGLPTGWVGVI